MGLPILNASTYNLTLPFSKQEIQYRSMLVGEEKILAIAKNSEDDKVIMDSIKRVIKQCSLETVNPDKLALIDFEYLFLHIRIKSKGEISEVKIPCSGEKCEHKIEVDIDLESFKMRNEEVESKVELTDTIGLMMKSPTLSVMKLLNKKNKDVNEYNRTIELVAQCIEFVYDGEELTYAKDVKVSELEAFLETLTTKQIKKVSKYLEGLPKIYFDLEYTCPKCKKVNKRTVEGIDNFF